MEKDMEIKFPKVTRTIVGNYQYFKEIKTGLLFTLLEDYIVNMTDGNIGQILTKYRAGTKINSSPTLAMDRTMFFSRFESVYLED